MDGNGHRRNATAEICRIFDCQHRKDSRRTRSGHRDTRPEQMRLPHKCHLQRYGRYWCTIDLKKREITALFGSVIHTISRLERPRLTELFHVLPLATKSL